MKSIIFCIGTFFVATVGGGPKVVAQFGEQGCPWSEELKHNVWNNSTFEALLKGAGIEREEKEPSSQEEPVAVLKLISSTGQEIGSVGYLMIAPEKYVDLFKEMLSIHTLCDALERLSVQQLLQLYRKAHVLHMLACEEKLLQRGLWVDPGVDFLIEHYAKLVQEHPRRAAKIKKEIRQRKPKDPSVEWELALLAFEAKRETLQECAKIVLPLEKFLRRFNPQEHDYTWRCHWVLAEFYRDQHDHDQAQHHASLAAEGAPDDLKPMIRAMGAST